MKTCEVKSCGRPHESNGLCKSHAQRLRGGRNIYCGCGEPVPLSRGYKGNECSACKNGKTCKVLECDNKVFQREYCSVHYMRWYRKTLEPPRCVVCKVEIESHYMKYCSKHRVLARRASTAASEHRRRAAEGTPYSREEIYATDGGVCYLCQGVVTYGLGHLDHIWPLSRGGHDAEYNVAIVHSRCNRIKNATLPENVAKVFPKVIFPERSLAWLKQRAEKETVRN